ncbi:MAG: tryptophan 7-halogenase [Candidatus Eremiobacterota bacterium]
MRKMRLGVIGAGSAGILSLTHFCTWLDNDWEIVSIHNPDKKILGIGESTNGGFVGLLEKGLHFSLGRTEDLQELDATIKYGSRFVNWRPHEWINPLLDGNTAIHFNNFFFKGFAYGRLQKLWPKKFRILEGDVTSVVNHPNKVTLTISGQPHDFDYVMDCMGFPQDFAGYTLSDCSPVNRCLIHSQTPDQFTYEPFTDHVAHENGWMFGVPLQSRKTFGYMFNDTITDRDEAEKDMKRLLKAPELDAAVGRGITTPEYKFKCYYANEMIQGRVGKNGNKALFFEPLIANSIFLYIYTARVFYDFVLGNTSREGCNGLFVKAVNEMEDVITYYYQGGSQYDTKFWKYATKFAKKRLKKRHDFTELMRGYRDLKSRGILNHGPTYAFVPLTWEIVDEALGYKYF